MPEDTSSGGAIRRIHSDLEHIRTGIEAFWAKHRPAITPEDRTLAAMQLAKDAQTCASLLAGRQVRVGNLNAEPLRHALRRSDIVILNPDEYALVTDDMLDAIVEAGPCQNPDAT
jgi:sugar/nucleoside kinase (ribokinase family)